MVERVNAEQVDDGDARDFSREAERPAPGIVREFWDFVRLNKLWWMLPIIVILLLLGIFILLSSTAVAPFIYTLF